jgi:hypothetical protein
VALIVLPVVESVMEHEPEQFFRKPGTLPASISYASESLLPFPKPANSSPVSVEVLCGHCIFLTG